jgi:hypothetical protein
MRLGSVNAPPSPLPSAACLHEVGITATTATPRAPACLRVEGEHEPRRQRRAACGGRGRLPRGADGREAESVQHGEAGEDELEATGAFSDF